MKVNNIMKYLIKIKIYYRKLQIKTKKIKFYEKILIYESVYL